MFKFKSYNVKKVSEKNEKEQAKSSSSTGTLKEIFKLRNKVLIFFILRHQKKVLINDTCKKRRNQKWK